MNKVIKTKTYAPRWYDNFAIHLFRLIIKHFLPVSWFRDSIGPYQHLSIARMRALENGIPIIRTTNDGISAFVDHQGNITDKLDKFKKGVLTAKVTSVSGKTPYRMMGPDWSYILILLIPVFILSFALYRGRSVGTGS